VLQKIIPSQTNQKEPNQPMTKQTDPWPYCEGSGLIDRDLARSIREWALTEMTEAELNSYSQRQLMQMYIQRGPRY